MTELLCELEPQLQTKTLAALPLHSMMAALLDSDAIDLAAISDAIRREPGFAEFVLRISESLALAPGAPLGTVEEAAIVLGKNRLYVIWRAWMQMHAPRLVRTRGHAIPISRHSHEARVGESHVSDASPEVLYLASFFRWLGFESSPEKAAPQLFAACPPSLAMHRAANDEIAALTELLMRDVISLIPYVEPVLLNAQPKTPPEVLTRAAKESQE
jgi:hypothetical protein